jgi:uncharacterized protein (TIGR02466 family)
MKTISLFPTLICREKIASHQTIKRLNKDLKSDIYNLMKIDIAGQKWSEVNYPGGYTSYGSQADLHLRFSTFEDLKKRLDIKVNHYAKSLEWDLQHGRLEMSSCWVNVMPEMSFHSLHLHPLAVISGTYYVQVPKDSGELKIEDPRLNCFMASPPRRAKSRFPYTHRIQPKVGEYLLWESWLRHEVTANRGAGERLSISFNYHWV